MVRLCLRALAGCAAAWVCLGCTGQNIEGTWLGPLPIEGGSACRIRIYSDHRFDVSCGDLEYAGAGKYERVGTTLTLHFAAFVRKGQAQRDKPTIALGFDGQGNQMRLGEVGSDKKPLTWRREPI